mgnify:CR=1 FL=1
MGTYATFREEGPYIGEAKVTEADVYLGVELVKDRLSLYLDEHVAPGGASSREAFALFAIERAGFYVKGGKFFLPFGLRLQDDDAASRRGTGFTLETADIGAEVGFDTGAWSSALSITNGTSGGAEADNGKQYCCKRRARLHAWADRALRVVERSSGRRERQSVASAFGTFRAGPIVVPRGGRRASRTTTGTAPEAARRRRPRRSSDALAHAGLTLRLFAGAGDLDRSDGLAAMKRSGA